MTYRNRFLLSTAAAALMCGAVSAKGYAADLGGGCCGDLEERVAELEATTARKGNRVVSLEISGQVNRALLIWDDGDNSDAYVVDPDSDGSRFRFVGKAQLKPGWSAGYIIELTTIDSASNQVSQLDDEGPDQPINIRQNGLFVDSERLGRLTIGQVAQPTDGINEIDVVGTYTTVAKTHYAGAFFVNHADGERFDEVERLRFQDILGAIGGGQEDIVRYDSPSIYGFIISAAWGDDDVWDVALHFEKQFNSVKVVGGIGYLDDQRDNEFGDGQTPERKFQNGNSRAPSPLSMSRQACSRLLPPAAKSLTTTISLTPRTGTSRVVFPGTGLAMARPRCSSTTLTSKASAKVRSSISTARLRLETTGHIERS